MSNHPTISRAMPGFFTASTTREQRLNRSVMHGCHKRTCKACCTEVLFIERANADKRYACRQLVADGDTLPAEFNGPSRRLA
jgi:hypothetical protein